MRKRKPVLLVDDTEDSRDALDLFEQNGLHFVQYHIKKFDESCCGELPTTRAPSVFAQEGIFKGLDGVKEYLAIENKEVVEGESVSMFW